MRMSLLALSVATLSVTAHAAVDETLIVTANRVAQTVDETLASVTVITREDIERKQVQSLPELLRTVPGVTVTQSGGQGSVSSVFLRGAESDHVLLLIDGVKVASATAGGASWGNLPLGSIERIEIVRGPRASLYGSEAIGGVIQIFTRDVQHAKQFGADLTVGRDNYAATNVQAGAKQGPVSISLSHHMTNTNGFNACKPESATLFKGCFDNEPDNDAYRELGGSLRLGFDLSAGGKLAFNVLKADSEVEYDGSFQNRSDVTQQVASVALTLPLRGHVLEVRAGQHVDELDSFNDGVYVSTFNTRRNQLSAQISRPTARGVVTVGGEVQVEDVDSTTSYPVSRRHNRAAFMQWINEVGAGRSELSLRHDNNSQYGEKTTGSLTLGRMLAGETRGYISYGTAFKAPTMNELYFPFFGTPDLKPEVSWSVETGVKGRQGELSWEAALFHTRIHDLISFDPSTFLAANLNNARISGLELGAQGEWDGLFLATTVTLQNPESQDPATKGNLLPRRAKEKLTLTIEKRMEKLMLGADWLVEGRRYDNLANTDEVDGYGRLDLRARYQLHPSLSLSAKIENVTDQEYETVAYYNQQGRAGYLTLSWQP
ncbi:MAG: TonB-dependent receptor [Gammaproteobacteria bacterium]|nr:MAG: TonB-dependent receptor [Gammaproteobacteria bacterium]